MVVGYRVRVPTPDDALDLGRVHVRAWQAAYRGGLPPAVYVDTLSATDRAAMWRTRLHAESPPRSARRVAVAEDGSVVGFVLVGPAEDADARTGEVQAINVDPAHWGQGAGCDLLATGVLELERAGFERAVLWVHPGNAAARRFFELHGWSPDEVHRQEEVLGVDVPQTRYSRSLRDEGRP